MSIHSLHTHFLIQSFLPFLLLSVVCVRYGRVHSHHRSITIIAIIIIIIIVIIISESIGAEKESQKPSVINPPRSVITHTPAAHILLSDTLFLFERKREEVEEDIVGQFRFPSLSLLLRLSKRWGLNARIRTAASSQCYFIKL